MTYDRQQLLWQKQVTIIGSINLGSHINEYRTGSPISTHHLIFVTETNKDHIIRQLFWAEESCMVVLIKWFVRPHTMLLNVFKQ